MEAPYVEYRCRQATTLQYTRIPLKGTLIQFALKAISGYYYDFDHSYKQDAYHPISTLRSLVGRPRHKSKRDS